MKIWFKRIRDILSVLLIFVSTMGWAQSWDYAHYDHQKGRILGQAKLTQAGSGGYGLQILLPPGSDRCLGSVVPATLEFEGMVVIVTPTQTSWLCESIRLVLLSDGTGGYRQIKGFNGRWASDNLDRSLKAVAPTEKWFTQLLQAAAAAEAPGAEAHSTTPDQVVANAPVLQHISGAVGVAAAQLKGSESSKGDTQALSQLQHASSGIGSNSLGNNATSSMMPQVAASAPAERISSAPSSVIVGAPLALNRMATASVVPKLRVRALVIGNSAYSSFGRLPNPRNDAEAIAAKFKAMGIEVDLVLDADRDRFVKALNDYSSRAVGHDINILYYAGHGVQVEGTNYLVPTNMRADGISAGYIKLSGISLNAALDYMPSSTRIVFLDACRDNPASRSLVATRSAGAVGLAPVNSVSGTLIAYATKDGSTAEDGHGSHSPYTSALLEHLDRPEDIGIVLRRVRQTVMRLTSNRQEPWEYGSLVGEQLVLSQTTR